MRRIHREFEFEPGATTVTTSVDEVLAQRSGVCQDFAHVMIACLRSHGLPARYVSGYLLTQPPPGRPRLLGADVSHAWVAAYSPQHGWVELDPTNDTLADRRYITLATGARLRRRRAAARRHPRRSRPDDEGRGERRPALASDALPRRREHRRRARVGTPLPRLRRMASVRPRRETARIAQEATPCRRTSVRARARRHRHAGRSPRSPRRSARRRRRPRLVRVELGASPRPRGEGRLVRRRRLHGWIEELPRGSAQAAGRTASPSASTAIA